jgi:hypothetical protein
MKQQDRASTESWQATGSPPEGHASFRPVRPSITQRRWGRRLVSAFLVWHLFAVTIWLLPESALRQSCFGLVSPYMTLTGFMQSWSMFSPSPASMDVYVEARVTYADGRVRSWNFPRMRDLGYIERYRHERFRKLIEMASPDVNRVAWPTLARYAARRNNIYPRNPPVSVSLVRHFRPIPPPGMLFAPFQTYVFFQTPIQPGELR